MGKFNFIIEKVTLDQISKQKPNLGILFILRLYYQCHRGYIYRVVATFFNAKVPVLILWDSPKIVVQTAVTGVISSK